MSIVPRGMSVMELYRLYRNNSLIVNRRYQRKLVWTKQEKEALIDSVMCQYPIPLILLAEVKGDKNQSENSYEIIDGMQRLNALYSFIENEISVNGEYFDVNSHPLAKSLVEEKIFTPVHGQEFKFIDSKKSARFLEYQIPVSTFSGTEKEINEVFGRINSNGKHLSPQEVRQAGVTTTLSELVRELSSEIRGDVSKDRLPLPDMPEISIDSRNFSLGYGVSAEETFWCKQGILRVSQLRDSEDEQFIADLIISIALASPFPASKENFDEYYGKGLNEKKKAEIESAIASYGKENLRKDIKYVFDTIQTIVFANSEERGFLKLILNPNAGSNPIKEPFYTFFMAIYALTIKENNEPFDYKNIIDSVKNLASKTRSATHHIKKEDRVRNINSTIGLLRDYFKKSEDSIRHSGTLALDFENYLRRSKVEAPMYDFKQGFYTLNPTKRVFDENSFEKIMHNIIALANLGSGKKGFLFIGVSDREDHTKQVEILDNVSVPRINSFGIVGLEREANIKGVSLDDYISFIVDKIMGSDLPNWLKSNISSSFIPITYKDMTVIMLEIAAGDSPAWYNNEMYIRSGASCVKITGSQVAEVFNRF